MTVHTAHEPRKRPRQRRSIETVERILEAAARLFDEVGYAATTTNRIADVAGISIGSLYQYFPNKDALLVALADRHVADAATRLGAVAAALRIEDPPLEVVVGTFVRAAVELNDSDRLHGLLAHTAPRTPSLEARLELLLAGVAEEVRLHLVRLGAGGADPSLTATLVVDMVDAAVHRIVTDLPAGPSRGRAVEHLVGMIIGALGGAPAPERCGSLAP